jgi:hypothetical protein
VITAIKYNPQSACLVFALLVTAVLAAGHPVAAAEQVLDAGAVHVVPASAATCFTKINIVNPGPSGMNTIASCDGGRLRLNLSTGESILPNIVDVSANSRFVTQFRVPAATDAGGAPAPSFLPVSITLNVDWDGRLFNDNFIPGGFFAWANVNMYVRLREGDAANPASQGRILKEFRFNGASHGGVAGCLSMPSSAVGVAESIVKCTVGVLERNSGSQQVAVEGVIETGRTYDLEVDVDAVIHSANVQADTPASAGAHPLIDFQTGDRGLKPGDITIDLGSDPQAGLGDLQRQIDKLRSDFEHHTHQYLTGRGVGQNNTAADTGPPVVTASPTPPQPPQPPSTKPIITSASLTRTKGGGNTIFLDVVGTSFVAGSTVRWNGADRSTTYVDPTHLRAVLAPRDVGRPGSAAITVADPPPSDLVSDPYVLTVK